MGMRKAGRAFFAVVFICVLIACSNGYNKESGEYSNKGKGFSIQFPRGWDETKDIPGAVFGVANPEGTSVIGVTSQKVPDNLPLEKFVQGVSSMYRGAGVRILGKGAMTIGGSEGFWSKMNISMGGQQFITLMYHAKNGEMAYAIVCNTALAKFSEYEETCNDVAKSFRFES